MTLAIMLGSLSGTAATSHDMTFAAGVPQEQQAYLEEFGGGMPAVTDPSGGLTDITWTPIPDALSTFGRAAGGVIGDFFYVFGGQNTSDLAIAYQFSTETWSYSTPALQGSYNSGFCVADGSLYKLAGTGATSDFERFEPSGDGDGTWHALTLPPSAFRTSTNGCAWIGGDAGDFIYVNNCDYSTPPVGHFARYSISGNSWETLTPPPAPRRYAGLACVDGKVYLIGGLAETGHDWKLCQVYDPDQGTWTDIASHPDSLNFTSTTVVASESLIWTVGHGGGYSPYPSSPHVHYYDPGSNTWTAETDLPVPRGLALASFDPSFMQLVHGGGNFNGSTNYQRDCRVADLLVGIGGFSPVHPDAYRLGQNYPNPFNVTTSIDFALPHFTSVRLSVFNLLGQEVASLFEGVLAAGEHRIVWDASRPASGVYFYKLEAGDFAQVRKMVLLR